MKSILKFKLSPEKCLAILKDHTAENSRFNFDALIKKKTFYGKFSDDYTFLLSKTVLHNGSSFHQTKGEIFKIHEGEFETQINIETTQPLLLLIVLGIICFFATLVFGFLGLVISIFISLILITLNRSTSNNCIFKIIEVIETEYD